MQVIYKRCASGDVHKKTIVVCVLMTHEDGRVEKFIRTFRTMTADLLALDEWLSSLGVECMAIESTGMFWHRVFNILEEGRSIILVNPQHLLAFPSKQTVYRYARRHLREIIPILLETSATSRLLPAYVALPHVGIDWG